jgi:hypothetical protein
VLHGHGWFQTAFPNNLDLSPCIFNKLVEGVGPPNFATLKQEFKN